MRNQVIFDDYEMPTLTFQISKSGGKSKEFSLQTENQFIDTGTDAVKTEQKNIQINMDQPLPGEAMFYVSTEDDEINKRLIKFLKKAVPLLDKEIEQSSLQIAYQKFDPDSHETEDETKIVASLQNINREIGSLIISDVDWNSSGTILSVSYSEPDHQAACSHKSFICIWNLFRKGLQNASSQIIETNGCISCLKFHPVRSSIIACGTFSGEIYLYNIDKEDDNLIAKTGVDDYFHREIITKLIWWEDKIPGTKQIFYNLLSLSTDGKILLWETKFDENKQLFQFPLKGFSLLRKKAQDILPVGALTMQQSQRGRNSFIVGSEGGSLLQATLSQINHEAKAQSSINVRKGFNYHRNIYPFLLNLPARKLPDVLNTLQAYCTNSKTNNINIQTISQAKLQKNQIYPNCISFAYQPSVSPVTSISINEYGLVCVNGYEGYCKIYEEQVKQSLQTLDGGFEVMWLTSTKLGGFFGDEWMIIDWLSEQVITRIQILQGIKWTKKGQLVAIACNNSNIKIVKVNTSLFERGEDDEIKIKQKISEAKGD